MPRCWSGLSFGFFSGSSHSFVAAATSLSFMALLNSSTSTCSGSKRSLSTSVELAASTLTLYSEGSATCAFNAALLPSPPSDELMPGATSRLSKPPFSGICNDCECTHAFKWRSSKLMVWPGSGSDLAAPSFSFSLIFPSSDAASTGCENTSSYTPFFSVGSIGSW